MKKSSIILIVVFVALILFGIWGYVQYNKAYDYDYKIRNLQFDKIGLKNTEGILTVEITNKSSLSASVINSALKMYVNGVYVCDLSTDNVVTIAGNSSFQIPLKFDFEPHKILSIKNIFALENIADPDKTIIGFFGSITVKKGLFTVNIPIAIEEPYSWYV